jgi:hypothetical protein
VDEIPDYGGPGDGDIFDYDEAVSFVSGTWVLLDDDSIWVFGPPGVEFGYKIVDVFFGPIDFDLGPDQMITVHGKDSKRIKR